MNYGGKRFERGAINASSFFQVVENGCRFMPNAFKLAFWQVIAEDDVRSPSLRLLSERTLARRSPSVSADSDMQAKPIGELLELSGR